MLIYDCILLISILQQLTSISCSSFAYLELHRMQGNLLTESSAKPIYLTCFFL